MRTPTWLTMALLVSGCGAGGPALDGSLGDVLDIHYSRVTFERSEASLALRFVQARGMEEDTVLKVSASLEGLSMSPGMRIDLGEALQAGGARGAVTRNVFEDPVLELPKVSRGFLSFTGDPMSAPLVEGEFSVTFVQGTEVGAGRAVFGPFSAQVLK